MTDFQWPWQYSFPPFFTLQLNADVRKTQLDSWSNLVVSWGKHNNVTIIDVTESTSMEVFKNSSINRALPIDGIRVVLDELARRGNLEWTDKTKRRGYLYWRSPAEWGKQIYSWAEASSRISNVCTLYEITQGEDTTDQEFYGLDNDILIKALQHLQGLGKAELMDCGDGQGVKFL